MLHNVLGKTDQDQTDWMETFCYIDSQLDLGLDFDWAILAHKYAVMQSHLIIALVVCLESLSCWKMKTQHQF